MLTFDPNLVPREIMEFIRYGAIAGFIATTALVINLNWVTFLFVFHKKKTKVFWVLFSFVAVLIFLILLFIFSMIFERVMMFGLF